MNDNNRPDIRTILIVLAALFLITLLVILCSRNPGGGAVLSMAVYTRSASARAKLVRRQRRPGCCLVPAAVAIAASAIQVLCILGKLIGAITMPWLGVLLPLLVAVVLVIMFAPVRRD